MRKVLGVAALLCLAINGISQAARKTAETDKTRKHEQAAQNPPSQTIAIYEQPHSKDDGEAANQHQQEIEIQRQLSKFTGWLVAVGFLQFIVLAVQAVLFFQQRNIMEQHEEWMQKHDAKLAQLAEAANKDAEAARLNAMAAINAARPWVGIFGVHDKSTGFFTFKAGNFGNTPAEILSYSVNVTHIDNVENLPVPPIYEHWKTPLLSLLTPGRTLDEATLDLETCDLNAIALLDSAKPIAAIYFRILYRNPIESTDTSITHHESRMCFWCRAGTGNPPQVGGPKDYNKHT